MTRLLPSNGFCGMQKPIGFKMFLRSLPEQRLFSSPRDLQHKIRQKHAKTIFFESQRGTVCGKRIV